MDNIFTMNEQQRIETFVKGYIRNNTRPEGGTIKKGKLGDAKFPKCECENKTHRIVTRRNRDGSFEFRVRCNKCYNVGNKPIEWSNLPRQAIIRSIFRFKTYSGPISSDMKRNIWR